MKRYVTRHGQVMDYRDKSLSHLYPPGDILLSELGEEQARLLGVRLRELGFHGRIISSPYRRTLHTSEIIARETGCLITPYAPMREIFKTEGQVRKFRGLTIEEIRELYDCIDPEAELAYPWWCEDDGAVRAEDSEKVCERVARGYEEINAKYPDTELLFVGHGASSGALVDVLKIQKKRNVRTMGFNCALSMIDPDDPEAGRLYCDTSHMQYEITTSNYLTREEFDTEFFAQEYEPEIEIPSEIAELRSPKILHIGDTESRNYPYYRKLISLVKPDIILHTGDMADEVKVGRIPGTEYEYISKIKVLLGIMSESGARLIIVPGNNDLPDEIRKIAPQAEVYPVNTVLTIDGIECRIGHQVMRMTFDRDWSFYGHGLTGETWKPEYNIPTQPCRFNVVWGSYVCALRERKFFRIPLP